MNSRTILFSGHDFRFLRPFIARCERDPRYRVLVEQHEGHVIGDTRRAQELLSHADVIFCEWCLGNAVWYSRHARDGQKLIVRLHLQELRLPYLDQVDWSKVAALVLICPANLERIQEQYPELRDKAVLIHNPISCDTLSQPKLLGCNFNLGFIGVSPKRKAPHLAIEILRRLRAVDRRYTLFIKGNLPWHYRWLWDLPDERAYYERLFSELETSGDRNAVVFEPYDDAIADWLSKIGFILSTSDFEGSHQAVAEGMASGALPIIRNWTGADLLYPAEFVFRNVEEAVQLVLRLNTPARYDAQSDAVRDYARQHFDEERIVQQLNELVADNTRDGAAVAGLARTAGHATMVPAWTS